MTNRPSNFYNRRAFIKIAGFGIIGFFVLLWQQLITKHLSLTGAKGFQKINLSGKVDGIYFYDTFLIVKKGAALTVLNNRCTHAGCLVNKEQNGEIHCACHGSIYKGTGEVIKGPATKPLAPLNYSVDPVTGELTVKL